MKISLKESNVEIPMLTNFKTKNLNEEQVRLYEEMAGEDFPYLNKTMLCLFESKREEKSVSYYITAIANNIRVIKRFVDYNTKESSYLLETIIDDKAIEFEVSAETLTTQSLKVLMKNNVLFDENYSKQLQKYLVISAQNAPIKTVHKSLGWNGDLFLSSKVFPIKDDSSKYIGNIDFQPKGSKEEYLDMIKSQVLNHTPLLFVWLVGFSSVILDYLNKHFDFGSLIFALNNLSSKGKTTAAMLATSIASNPIFDRGLITNFSGTSNATLGFVAQCNGHTVVLDEAGTAESLQSRKLLYQMCSGRERKRLNTSGELKETAEFNSAIIITSEYPIIDSSAPNGIRARVYEITDNLTISAEHSNKIKSTVLANYGLLYEDFISFVCDNLNTIIEDYNVCVNELKNNHKGCKGELTERVLEKLSVVYLTAKYVKKCFEIEISTATIREYIYTLENRINTEADIADKALDCILDYISRNSSKFIRANISDYDSCVEGKIIKSNNHVEISILKSVADSILSKNGFENVKTIAHKWQGKGILVSEGDRANKRIKLTKDLPVQACYVFNLSLCNDEHITKCKLICESVSSDNLDDIDIYLN